MKKLKIEIEILLGSVLEQSGVSEEDFIKEMHSYIEYDLEFYNQYGNTSYVTKIIEDES